MVTGSSSGRRVIGSSGRRGLFFNIIDNGSLYVLHQFIVKNDSLYSLNYELKNN